MCEPGFELDRVVAAQKIDDLDGPVPLGTNDDLLRYVEDTFGVRIPRTRCCAAHRTPAEAFCDSYFARAPVTVWNASRAFGGKTFLLSLLALTEALTLEGFCHI